MLSFNRSVQCFSSIFKICCPHTRIRHNFTVKELSAHSLVCDCVASRWVTSRPAARNSNHHIIPSIFLRRSLTDCARVVRSGYIQPHSGTCPPGVWRCRPTVAPKAYICLSWLQKTSVAGKRRCHHCGCTRSYCCIVFTRSIICTYLVPVRIFVLLIFPHA